MYAAVKAGREGLLISNDEMRDHIFQLLAPKFFYKWKQASLTPCPAMICLGTAPSVKLFSAVLFCCYLHSILRR